MRKVLFFNPYAVLDEAQRRFQCRADMSLTSPLTPAGSRFHNAPGVRSTEREFVNSMFPSLVPFCMWQAIVVFMCASNRRFPFEIRFMKRKKRRRI